MGTVGMGKTSCDLDSCLPPHRRQNEVKKIKEKKKDFVDFFLEIDPCFLF